MNGENRSRAEIEREMVLSTFYHGLGPIRQWLDDDTVTYEQLVQSMASSQYGDWIRHSTVYSDMYNQDA